MIARFQICVAVFWFETHLFMFYWYCVPGAFDTHELVSTFRASFALLKYKHVWLIWTQIKVIGVI